MTLITRAPGSDQAQEGITYFAHICLEPFTLEANEQFRIKAKKRNNEPMSTYNVPVMDEEEIDSSSIILFADTEYKGFQNFNQLCFHISPNEEVRLYQINTNYDHDALTAVLQSEQLLDENFYGARLLARKAYLGMPRISTQEQVQILIDGAIEESELAEHTAAISDELAATRGQKPKIIDADIFEEVKVASGVAAEEHIYSQSATESLELKDYPFILHEEQENE